MVKNLKVEIKERDYHKNQNRVWAQPMYLTTYDTDFKS